MKYLFILLISFMLFQTAYSQSVLNMTLLGSKNEFTSGGTPAGWYYSSCWGWTAPNGREYAIIGFYGGTIWYDITNPANIVRCDTIYGPGSFYNYREMATYQNYCYIVSEGGLGVQIVDMQYLPDSVHLVKNYTFPGYVRSHTVRNEGRYLYCNGGNYNNGGVFILDLLDPENPVKRGQWGTRYVHDCHVRNDTIYAACISNSNLTVIDATNKDSLKQVTFWTYPGAVTHNAWTSKNGDYLITTDEGGSNHAKVWSIGNIMAPLQVADIVPYEATMVHNAYVKGDTLYLAHYRSGLLVYDISNPLSPQEIGRYDTYPGGGTAYQGAWNCYPYFASGKIVISDISTGLYVVQMGTSVGIGNNNGTTPGEYKLEQNYPNPFNPETKISYSLPSNSNNVSLVIYNALGKELAKYVYSNQAAGNYEITWNAKELSSGIYFYKLTAGNFSDVKKMMLVR
ncbi:MAG TPA: choice-of-anchor B family protein [Ignavibacteria bacterium]|nr:choice-of-anchor B family protein [Ignavibacteria bacterium]